MTSVRFMLVVAVLIGGSGWAAEANAAYIQPVSSIGTGSFSNSAALITDGLIPTRGTGVFSSNVVFWNDTNTAFTIDFGSVYRVASLTAALDNNDDYVVQYSTNGTTFTNLFTFLAADGPVSPNQGGLDILTTDSSYPSTVAYPGNITTPAYVGRGFAAVDARYLRIAATGGDSIYGIGELDAYTAAVAVPEPSSFALCGVAGALSLAVIRALPRVRKT